MRVSAQCQQGSADVSLQASLPIARALKTRIALERRLTATIGVAPNKLLANIASDHQKPDGLTLIAETSKAEFLRLLPVWALFGVDAVTEWRLRWGLLWTLDESIEPMAVAGDACIDVIEHTAGRDRVGEQGPPIPQIF